MAIKITSAVNGMQIFMRTGEYGAAHRFATAENKPYIKVENLDEVSPDSEETLVVGEPAKKAPAKTQAKAAKSAPTLPEVPAVPVTSVDTAEQPKEVGI
jgi:hypothetical protein